MDTKRILIVFLFLFSFLSLLKVFSLENYIDFSAYYNGFQNLSQNPYQNGLMSIIYPPAFFVVFFPFFLTPLYFSKYLWLFFSITSLFASFYLIFKANKVSFCSNLSLLVLAFSFLYFPTKFTLGNGQVNLFILLILSFIYFFSRKNFQKMTGLFLSLSFSIKLFSPLLILYFLVSRKFKTVFYFLVFSAILTLFSLCLIGSENFNYFFSNILPSTALSVKTDYYNQALSGFIYREFGVSSASLLLRSIASLLVIGFALLVIIIKRNEKNFDLEFSFIVTASLIINTFSWQHHFVYLLLPLTITLLYQLRKTVNLLQFFLLAIAYGLTAMNLKDPASVPSIVQSHVLFGAFILMILNAYQLLRKD